MKQLIIDDTSYQVSHITAGQFEDAMKQGGSPAEINFELVACCLNNADQGKRTAADIRSLPLREYRELLTVCLEINGLVPAKNAEAAKTGE